MQRARKTAWTILMVVFFPLSVLFAREAYTAGYPDDSEVVVAEVGDEKIMLKELKDAAKGSAARGFLDLTMEDKKKILNDLILYRIFFMEANNRKLYDVPEVKDQIDRARKGILVRYFRDTELVPRITVSEDEKKDYYEANKSLLVPPPLSTLTTIQVVKTSATEFAPEEAGKLAESIRARLDKGESFEQIIASYREDKTWGESISNEPRQIRILKGTEYQGTNFDSVIFGLEKGHFGVAEVQDRFFIVRLDDLKTNEPPPLKSVETAVIGKIKQKKWDALMKEFLEEMEKKIPVKVNQDLMK